MVVGRWGRVRRYGLWSGVPALVAAVAGWAALADDKHGWTVVAAALAGAAGAFGPTVADRVAAARERRQLRAGAVAVVRVADLPVSVTRLLRPDQQVVPFFGRGWVLRQLEMWAGDPDAVAVRLLTGAGGVGKTRLARELASRLAGWRCEWISPHAEAETTALVASGGFGPRSLLVLDYAEARDRAAVAELLWAVHLADRVRVVLLARSAGLWWESLPAAFDRQAHLVEAMTTAPGVVVEVTARVDDAHDPKMIVADAAAAFAERLGRPVPVLAGMRAWPVDTPVLRLHADALVAVLDGAHRQGDYDVLGEVLGHESRYWRFTARRAGLFGAGDDPTADRAVRQVVGIAALMGADSPAEVEQVVRRAPLLAEADAARIAGYVSWLSGLYPAGQGSALGVVQPDLLAESVATRVLTECGVQERARVLSGSSAAQAVRVLTVLGRARVHQAGVDTLIDAALGVDVPGMVEAVIEVGVQFPGIFTSRVVALLADATIEHGWARQTAARVPYPSLELGQLALGLTTHIVTGFPADTSLADRAHWATWHALRLAESGRRAEALTASQEAVDLYRESAGLNRDAYLPDLALSMNNHSIRLAESGRRAEALTASQEAVDLYRESAGLNRDAYLPDLAMSVNNHANRLADAGRRAEALITIQEAVDLRRELARLDRDAYLPNLATSVNNHAIRLAESGRRAEALIASQEAVDLYRELAGLNRDAYLPNLATSVNNLAVDLAEAGRRADALVASQEAVDLRRELAGLNRDAYLPDLAMSVNNHANRLADSGRRAEALIASQEAVDLRRELARLDRDAYLPDLATSLWNVGFVALKVGCVTDDVVALTAEGVRYFETLAASEPAAFASRHEAAAKTLAELHQSQNPATDGTAR
ncbi:tetratricopeptide repeat protein [Actinoplanes digitatis]|uniref:HEPN domain-containing protein n=4 Tax=Actinoplanes digitatis TaxID=1868 RepID=A0A7W7I3F3_9ACTN|nr:tetratricopeptide repeat protein [Actinoplanes digitatis]MBB4765717.1 HEPN domain-containing protein [Actinoplanes digitatis]